MGGTARSYSATSVPAILAHDADIAACTSARAGPRATATRTSSARAAAPTCWSSTWPPREGGLSQMHRTCSIDFSICVFGVAKMELDGGETLSLKPGMSVSPPPSPPLLFPLFFYC